MPALLKQKKFEFVSQALPEDTFGVVNFNGSEGFSTCYQFEIMLVSDDPKIDTATVLQNPVVFTILRDDGDIPFHGILSQFEQLHAVDDVVFYRAVLVPKLWWLSLTRHNQIFLDKTAPQILEAVLKDGGLTTNDFELRLEDESKYPSWEFICQYRESHLDFVSRWMEREGMYYYFEQTAACEKMIITDTNLSHTAMPEGQTMYYSPPTGLDETRREEVIHTFILKHKLLPGKLHVQDYNYRTPSVNLSAEAPVSDQGRGEIHIYGEHFRTLQEGSGLANIRVQELLSHEKRFHGESTIPYLRPGYRFDLKNHYRDDFDQQYLTIELMHKGSQTGFLISGISQNLAETEERPYYRNTFVTIPGQIQYRHPKKTEKPHFYGTINARIDAQGSGEYAQLDEQGRYKVILPFDLSGRRDAKASHWMRMAQPYAGENQGMHFPLHKHTEVLLTFIEGDPDRPIIASAIPNPESPSPINGVNQTQSIIKTGKGPATSSVGAEYVEGEQDNNYIEFEDESTKKHVVTYTPKQKSWIRLGYPGDNPGNQGNDPDTLRDELSPHPGTTESGIRMKTQKEIVIEAGDGYTEIIEGPSSEVSHYDDGTYSDTRDCDSLVTTMKGFAPPGFQVYTDGANPHRYALPGNWEDLLKIGHVKVARHDTFNLQEGNIYDFGGYWNYNLGNCYIENHMGQSATLNQKGAKDLMDIGGPGWQTIDDDALDVDDNLEEIGGDWSNGNVWVEKKFGNSYDYVEGSSIEVKQGSSLEVQHGGKHIEWLYRSDGSKKLYTMIGGNKDKGEDKAEEKKWLSTGTEVYHKMVDHDFNETEIITNPDQGAYSYQYTTYPSWFTFKAGLSYIPQISISAKVALIADIGVFAGATFNLKTGASIGLDLDLRAGGAFVLKPSGGLKFDGVGFTARKKALADMKKAELEAEQAALRLHMIEADLSKASIKLQKVEAEVKKPTISCKIGLFIFQ